MGAALLVGGGWLLAEELDHSRLQARFIAGYAAKLGFSMGKGPSDAARYPAHGPFDLRMGYAALPQFTQRLKQNGYELTEQARLNEAAQSHFDRGYFLPFAEKTRVGLDVLDFQRKPMYGFRYPYRGYPTFQEVPEVVIQSLLFIENRDLLDASRPKMNPAVDWLRFGRAVMGQVGRVVDEDFDTPGGSTLATQIEKYRHSPNGITHNGREKLRQMVSASVRAYRNGEETMPLRRQVVLDYLNTVPLSAAPRHGEVNGLGDGLWVWFDSDFDHVNALLAHPEAPGIDRVAQGRSMRQVVALMIAHRRPSWYLARGREDLAVATNSYLRLLAQAGIISTALRDEALAQPLAFRDMAKNPPFLRAQPGKGTTAVRARFAGILGTSLYSLDRLDAELITTLHGGLQHAVTQFLGKLSDPEVARTHGLLGERLLSPSRVDGVRYSFTLIERGQGSNRVRVQTDTTDQPLDINEGSKLELGSTAKLRVLTTYLELLAEQHAKLSGMEAADLRSIEVDRQDSLKRWAIDYLISAKDRNLTAMLDAALERRFSASPGEAFFTGGGLHVFGNFNKDDNGRNPTLRESLQASINLPFVRLMREIVRHTIYQEPDSTAKLLKDIRDPRRDTYLARFADREGQTFLRRFWRKTDNKTGEEMRSALIDGLSASAERLSAVFRYLEPEAPPEALDRFLESRLREATPKEARLADLYQRYAPGAFDLPDRSYIARVHPLELWLVAYRLKHPKATFADAVRASTAERQAVYRWLFRTRAKSAQDSRIYTMLEVEAFLDIHRRWSRLGYPFGHLVPSLATALGSSGDRPASLSELMGIIMNDGTRQPTRRIEKVRFAAGTSYETAFEQAALPGERVMAPAVAKALQGALSDVVERGTARRLTGAFRTPDGQELRMGGKTGTGDNRVRVLGRVGLALNRTATFVFSLGPNYFGTITAYVVGPDAAKYKFTSALPVQILRSMGPVLMPHLAQSATALKIDADLSAVAASKAKGAQDPKQEEASASDAAEGASDAAEEAASASASASASSPKVSAPAARASSASTPASASAASAASAPASAPRKKASAPVAQTAVPRSGAAVSSALATPAASPTPSMSSMSARLSEPGWPR
jgi:membrane peptidoglycan carboxypeptidase